jgi:hypothetical protein
LNTTLQLRPKLGVGEKSIGRLHIHCRRQWFSHAPTYLPPSPHPSCAFLRIFWCAVTKLLRCNRPLPFWHFRFS